MFWGLSSFNVSRGHTQDFNLQTDFYLNAGDTIATNYSSVPTTYSIMMAHFFIATRDCSNGGAGGGGGGGGGRGGGNNDWF